jgi:hypothetical protein
MTWLDTLLDRGREAKEATQAPTLSKPTHAKLQIQSWWIQTAAPSPPDYVGAIEPVFYFVRDGALTLCDETGKSSGKPVRLEDDDDPRRIAAMLKRSTMPQESDFNRALDYPNVGVA